MINKYITRILGMNTHRSPYSDRLSCILNASIGKLTGALSEEAGLALNKTFLDDPGKSCPTASPKHRCN